MMARAKAVREGVAPPEPLKPSAQSSKPTPAKAKAPTAPKPAVTRDQMFADFQSVKIQKAEQTAKSQLSRYGQEKPRAREARAPEQQAERPDPSAMGGASKPAPPTAEEYAKFGQLLGSGAGARGPVRAVSDEVLTRGDQLPLPARGRAGRARAACVGGHAAGRAVALHPLRLPRASRLRRAWCAGGGGVARAHQRLPQAEPQGGRGLPPALRPAVHVARPAAVRDGERARLRGRPGRGEDHRLLPRQRTSRAAPPRQGQGAGAQGRRRGGGGGGGGGGAGGGGGRRGGGVRRGGTR